MHLAGKEIKGDQGERQETSTVVGRRVLCARRWL